MTLSNKLRKKSLAEQLLIGNAVLNRSLRRDIYALWSLQVPLATIVADTDRPKIYGKPIEPTCRRTFNIIHHIIPALGIDGFKSSMASAQKLYSPLL